MKVEAAVLRAIAHFLQGITDGLFWVIDMLTAGAKLTLRCSRWCMDRAREWDPRLWDRDQDPRSDNRERRP